MTKLQTFELRHFKHYLMIRGSKFVQSTPPKYLMGQFETMHACWRHIKDVHENFLWSKPFIFKNVTGF